MDDNNVCNKWLSEEWWIQIEVSRSLRDKMVKMEWVLENFSLCVVNVLQLKNI